MKRSVSFMALFGWLIGCVPALPVRRVRSGAVAGLDGVVDLDGGIGAEFENARGHDLFAGLDSGEDGDLIAAGAAELDELLSDAEVALAVLALHLLRR